MDEQLGFRAWESWIPRVHQPMLLMQFQGRGSEEVEGLVGQCMGAHSARQRLGDCVTSIAKMLGQRRTS